MGLGTFPVWRIYRITHKELSKCFLRALVPLGMNWACSCCGNGVLLHSRKRVSLCHGLQALNNETHRQLVSLDETVWYRKEEAEG